VTNLSIELAKQRLIEADEAKKASVAKMKHRNRGTSEIKNPTAAVKRSERHDAITQIVQDSGFTADVAPKSNSDDIVPQADYADSYTKTMPHGMSAGMGGNGENQKSPKATGTSNMTPNQTTKLRGIKGEVKHTEDDGSQKTFTIPQAKYADEYTKSMAHGVAGGTTNEEGSDAAPAKRSWKKMDGGPTRAGGKRTAKSGSDVVGAKDKDKQKVSQVGQHKKETNPGDSPSKPTWKTETHGSHNIVESGVNVTLNGKRKASFEVVSHSVLNKMSESYAKHGYEVEFVRTDATWKSDKKFLKALRESVHARFNHAPSIAQQARKVAMQRFGYLCRGSYNTMYESRQEFVSTMGSAFTHIEKLAEDKYVNGLEFFDCMARIVVEDDVIDLEIMTHAADADMACRQIRNTVYEEYGFDTNMKHIFVDGKKYNPARIREYSPSIRLNTKKR
jgi:hypothetical protein